MQIYAQLMFNILGGIYNTKCLCCYFSSECEYLPLVAMSYQLCLLSSSPTFFLLYVLQLKYCVSPFCLKYCFLPQLLSLWGLLLAPSYLPVNISCVFTHRQAALTLRTLPIFLIASKMFHTFQIVSPFCVCFFFSLTAGLG